jgi:Na+-driven multidrug efflux pump
LGAQEGSLSLDYGRRYFEIILYGSMFNMVGFGMSHCTRAQGFPLMTMTAMFIGAGMNMILDPLFIFVFHWGVEGAAWATIFSQFCSSSFIVYFVVSKKAVVRLNFKIFKPSLRIVTQIMGFGSANCLMQLAMASVGFVVNWSMSKYGASSLGVENGGDIALSGMNIVQSLAMLILMPTFGINQGAQPVLGYNYGAQKFDRVRRAYNTAVGGASIICILGFIGCQLFSLPLIHIFAPDGSAALIYFAPLALRVGTIILPFIGFQAVSSNFFAVTGRPKVSSVLALLRQVIVLIPCLFIFGRLWGLDGLICATPVADGVAVVVTAVFIVKELKKLGKKEDV